MCSSAPERRERESENRTAAFSSADMSAPIITEASVVMGEPDVPQEKEKETGGVEADTDVGLESEESARSPTPSQKSVRLVPTKNPSEPDVEKMRSEMLGMREELRESRTSIMELKKEMRELRAELDEEKRDRREADEEMIEKLNPAMTETWQ